MGQKVDQTISRRGAERHAVSTFTCSLGMVVDFSRTGMRFCCDGKPAVAPGQRGSIQLAGPNTSMRLKARVVWVKRLGGWRSRKYHVGLEWVEIDARRAAAVESLGKYGFIDPQTVAGGLRWKTGKNQRKTRRTVKASFHLPNYYEVLGVEPEADLAAIKKAYRRLARQYHPDAGGDNAERFMAITEAANVLTDPDRRAWFDRQAFEQESDAE